jgi:hypothetical protein
VDFKGQKRTIDTHESRTDPDCRLFTKSDKVGAIPCYMGHAMTENRSHLVVNSRLTIASGTAEREAALEMLADTEGEQRKTVGGDKNFDTGDFVRSCREMEVTPHVAQNTSGRSSRIDHRTTRHTAYHLSQVARKMIETVFGDGKQHGILRQVKLRGLEKVQILFMLGMTVVNLRRLPRLLAMAPSG